ncbi:unnamed protein product [Arctogadus glacialis]
MTSKYDNATSTDSQSVEVSNKFIILLVAIGSYFTSNTRLHFFRPGTTGIQLAYVRSKKLYKRKENLSHNTSSRHCGIASKTQAEFRPGGPDAVNRLHGYHLYMSPMTREPPP